MHFHEHGQRFALNTYMGFTSLEISLGDLPGGVATWPKNVDLLLETALINSYFLPLRGQTNGSDTKAKLRGGSVSLITRLSASIMPVSQGLGFGLEMNARLLCSINTSLEGNN
jgi:hypothetical protein